MIWCAVAATWLVVLSMAALRHQWHERHLGWICLSPTHTG